MAVVRILDDMAHRFETSIIVVTHDEKIIPTFRRIYRIRDGVTQEEAGEGRGLVSKGPTGRGVGMTSGTRFSIDQGKMPIDERIFDLDQESWE